MPHIRLDDTAIELSTGELRIGTGDEAQVRLDAGPEKGTLAIIIVDPSGTPTVRRGATGATILVNGVALGAEPAPLLHGDRIEVAGRVFSAVISGEAPALAALAGERIRGGRALDAGTVVRFGSVKVTFRSEPQIVDADGGTRVIVEIKPSHQQRVPMARTKSLPVRPARVTPRERGASRRFCGSHPLRPSARPSFS